MEEFENSILPVNVGSFTPASFREIHAHIL
jgi:hypothetical protein